MNRFVGLFSKESWNLIEKYWKSSTEPWPLHKQEDSRTVNQKAGYLGSTEYLVQQLSKWCSEQWPGHILYPIDLQALACKLCGTSPPVRKTRTISASQAIPIIPSTPSPSTPAAKRAALIVANTYSSSDPLPGCKTSALKVKRAFELRGIVCQLEIDVSAQNLIAMGGVYIPPYRPRYLRVTHLPLGVPTFVLFYCLN